MKNQRANSLPNPAQDCILYWADIVFDWAEFTLYWVDLAFTELNLLLTKQNLPFPELNLLLIKLNLSFIGRNLPLTELNLSLTEVIFPFLKLTWHWLKKYGNLPLTEPILPMIEFVSKLQPSGSYWSWSDGGSGCVWCSVSAPTSSPRGVDRLWLNMPKFPF